MKRPVGSERIWPVTGWQLAKMECVHKAGGSVVGVHRSMRLSVRVVGLGSMLAGDLAFVEQRLARS